MSEVTEEGDQSTITEINKNDISETFNYVIYSHIDKARILRILDLTHAQETTVETRVS